jgi:exopolyphosphatase/guanosine-5'-triphosphate,3'-diphosphate pyrophosphatase
MVNSFIATKDNSVNIPFPKMNQDRILAAIDLGTNSLHMVVVRIQPSCLLLVLLPEKKIRCDWAIAIKRRAI